MFADNIFVGKVDSYLGQVQPSGFEESIFIVSVEENIKNELIGSVRVSTLGVQGNESDAFAVEQAPGGDELEPGESYVMATRYNSEFNFHTLAHATKVSPSSAQSRIQEQDSIVDEFRNGVESPLPPTNPNLPTRSAPPKDAASVDLENPGPLLPSESPDATTSRGTPVESDTTPSSPTNATESPN